MQLRLAWIKVFAKCLPKDTLKFETEAARTGNNAVVNSRSFLGRVSDEILSMGLRAPEVDAPEKKANLVSTERNDESRLPAQATAAPAVSNAAPSSFGTRSVGASVYRCSGQGSPRFIGRQFGTHGRRSQKDKRADTVVEKVKPQAQPTATAHDLTPVHEQTRALTDTSTDSLASDSAASKDSATHSSVDSSANLASNSATDPTAKQSAGSANSSLNISAAKTWLSGYVTSLKDKAAPATQIAKTFFDKVKTKFSGFFGGKAITPAMEKSQPMVAAATTDVNADSAAVNADLLPKVDETPAAAADCRSAESDFLKRQRGGLNELKRCRSTLGKRCHSFGRYQRRQSQLFGLEI